MTPRAIAVAVLLAIGVVGVAAGSAVGATDDDRPGRVLEASPRSDGSVAIRYRSTGVHGRTVEETGVVWLPEGKRSGDVVAWGHPTTGLADGCAPSDGDNPVPGLRQLLRAGHVVVAPDYEGLGTSGDHPYLVGTSEARSVLDAIRAARSVAHVDGRSAVFGWSQGGHAALFAARLARSYAPDVHLAGVAAIAPVTDMQALVDPGSSFARYPGFVALVAAGYADTYRDLDPAEVVPDAADALTVARGTCALEANAELAGTTTTTPGVSWDRRLEDNDPTTVGLRVPVLLVHGERDQLLPVDDSVGAYGRLCSLGTTVRLERYASAAHGDIVDHSSAEVVHWLDDRLAGDRLTGCAERRTRS